MSLSLHVERRILHEALGRGQLLESAHTLGASRDSCRQLSHQSGLLPLVWVRQTLLAFFYLGIVFAEGQMGTSRLENARSDG